jgi:hypothetical protein
VRHDYESPSIPRIGEIGLTGIASAASSAVYHAPEVARALPMGVEKFAISANAADFKFVKTNEKRYTEKT